MKKLSFVFIWLFFVIACQARIITVDNDSQADFNNIQDAIYFAWDGDIVEVQQGVYQENILFTGCAITVTSTDSNDPNVVEATIITCDSGYVVTIDFREGNDTVLQGFTIIASPGGGIYCLGTSPTIKKNVIRDSGTGISGSYGAAPVICNNKIIDNRSYGISSCDGPITGNFISGNRLSGLYECNGDISGNIIRGNGRRGLYQCNGTIRGNIIRDNIVTSTDYDVYGGGLYDCDGDIIGNFISGNAAISSGWPGNACGGGLSNCDGTIESNVISGNTTQGLNDSDGGGLYSCGGRIVGNTIVGNKTVRSGNLGRGGGVYNYQVYPEIKNNIIAYNKASSGGGIRGNCNNTYNFYYMNVGGDISPAGIGERRANPDFAVDGYWNDPCGTLDDLTDDVWVEGDYHLKSEAGRWDPNSKTWVFDTFTSHGIDAGDPNSDWSGEFWPHGKRINIGAYGGAPEASMSPLDLGNIADLNFDDTVNLRDFAKFAHKWHIEEILLPEDLNRDNHIDIIDVSIFVDNWLWEE